MTASAIRYTRRLVFKNPSPCLGLTRGGNEDPALDISASMSAAGIESPASTVGRSPRGRLLTWRTRVAPGVPFRACGVNCSQGDETSQAATMVGSLRFQVTLELSSRADTGGN